MLLDRNSEANKNQCDKEQRNAEKIRWRPNYIVFFNAVELATPQLREITPIKIISSIYVRTTKDHKQVEKLVRGCLLGGAGTKEKEI